MELSLERFDKPISKFKFSRNSWKYVESMRCWPTMTWTWKLLPNPTATKVHLLYQHMTGPPHKCCIYAGGPAVQSSAAVAPYSDKFLAYLKICLNIQLENLTFCILQRKVLIFLYFRRLFLNFRRKWLIISKKP